MRLKGIILVVLSLTTITTIKATTFGLGLKHNQIIIWEYWRVQESQYNREFIVFNPTDFLAKYEIRNRGGSSSLYQFEVKPQDYLIITNFDSVFMQTQRSSLYSFYNHGKNIGLYLPFPIGENYPLGQLPKTKFKNAIVSNRRLNLGRPETFIIQYNKFNFGKEKNCSTLLTFDRDKFIEAGFSKKNYALNEEVEYILEYRTGVRILENEKFNFYFVPTARQGNLSLNFSLKKYEHPLLVSKWLRYTIKRKVSSAIDIVIPRNINFNDLDKMIAL